MPRKKAVPEPVQEEPVQANDFPQAEAPVQAEEPAQVKEPVQAEEPAASEAREPPDAPAPKRPRRRNVTGDILRLSEEEVGITSEDSEDAKWGYLAGAVRREQILTGIVSNIVPSSSGNPACAVEFEGMRILIPYREMVLTEWPGDERAPDSVRFLLRNMLGATVEFIPAAVEVRERAAVGSRKAAMLLRQKQYYETERVKPGILVACRLLAVSGGMMYVEACGVDTEIYARNVAWSWFSDIADLYSSGDLVVAKVMDVKLDEKTGHYDVDLSIKAASEHSDRAAFERLIPHSNYFGTVTGVERGTFFVRLQSGVNAKTKIYHSKEYPARMDTVCFRVTRLDEENLVANGYITRIIKRHTRLR